MFSEGWMLIQFSKRKVGIFLFQNRNAFRILEGMREGARFSLSLSFTRLIVNLVKFDFYYLVLGFAVNEG